jgi:hypothetical protein
MPHCEQDRRGSVISRPIQKSGRQNNSSTTNMTQPAVEISLFTRGGAVV